LTARGVKVSLTIVGWSIFFGFWLSHVIDRHDLLRAAGRIVRQCPQMYDRFTARRRTLHLAEVEEILAVNAVKAGDVMPQFR